MMDAVQTRFSNLLYTSDLIYYISPAGFKYRKSLKYLHDFTMNVIKERKEKIVNITQDVAEKKRHLAFLDILLTAKVYTTLVVFYTDFSCFQELAKPTTNVFVI